MKNKKRWLIFTLIATLVIILVGAGSSYLGLKVLPFRIIKQENIFTEIYNDTYRRYPSLNPDIGNIKGSSTHDVPGYGDKLGPEYSFDKPSREIHQFESISASFNFEDEIIYFIVKKQDPTGIELSIVAQFNKNENKIVRKLRVIDNYGNTVEDTGKANKLLQEANITQETIEGYYNTAINDYILTEWEQVHRSDYSPANYGDITIINDWDKYFSK